MNKLWDDLKNNMKEWGASAVEKAEEISRVAVAKGEEFTKISKIKIEILQLQKEKSKHYEKLGGLVYHHAQDDNMANFTGNTEFFEIINISHRPHWFSVSDVLVLFIIQTFTSNILHTNNFKVLQN